MGLTFDFLPPGFSTPDFQAPSTQQALNDSRRYVLASYPGSSPIFQAPGYKARYVSAPGVNKEAGFRLSSEREEVVLHSSMPCIHIAYCFQSLNL